MTSSSWQLARIHARGVGKVESRFDPLDLSLDGNDGTATAVAVWAENGTGKTTLTALHNAMFDPNARAFYRTDSKRSFAELVRGDDTCHFVEEYVRTDGSQLLPQRLVIGLVAEWKNRHQTLNDASRLRREWYGWITDDAAPVGIDALPYVDGSGAPTSMTDFLAGVRDLMPSSPSRLPRKPTNTQDEWTSWLRRVGMDVDQLRVQREMNGEEGGIASVLKFDDDDAFVRWLVVNLADVDVTARIAANVDRLRAQAGRRDVLTAEAELFSAVVAPLRFLGAAHGDAVRAAALRDEAAARAVAALADADRAVAVLTARERREADLAGAAERDRGAVTNERRQWGSYATAMHARAATLAAERHAARLVDAERARDGVREELDAWGLVPTVVERDRLKGQIHSMEATLRQRHANAAPLRDATEAAAARWTRKVTADGVAAASRIAAAKDAVELAQQRKTESDDAIREAVKEDATQQERRTAACGVIDEGDDVVAAALADGLLREGDDPTRALEDAAEAAAGTRQAAVKAEASAVEAEDAYEEAVEAAREATDRADVAARTLTTARDAADSVDRRVRALLDLPGMLDAGPFDDPWAQAAAASGALDRRRRALTAELAAAHAAEQDADRVEAAVEATGVSPPSPSATAVAAALADAGIAHRHGWRWLADTVRADDVVAAGTRMPHVAAGVVLTGTADTDRAADVARTVDVNVPVWVGPPPSGDAHDVTSAIVVLPPDAAWDADAARRFVDDVLPDRRDRADRDRTRASRGIEDASVALGGLRELLADHPEDPRPALADSVRTAEADASDADAARDEAVADREATREERTRARGALTAAREDQESAAETEAALRPVAHAHRDAAAARADLDQRILPAIAAATRDRETAEADLADATEALRDAEAGLAREVRAEQDVRDLLRDHGRAWNEAGPVPDEPAGTLLAAWQQHARDLDDAEPDDELRVRLAEANDAFAEVADALGRSPEVTGRAERLVAEHPDARSRTRAADRVEVLKHDLDDARQAVSDAKADADRAASDARRATDQVDRRTFPDGVADPADVADETDAVAAEANAKENAARLWTLLGEYAERAKAHEDAASRAATDRVRASDVRTRLARFRTDTEARAVDVDPSEPVDTDAVVAAAAAAEDDIAAASDLATDAADDLTTAANQLAAVTTSDTASQVAAAADAKVATLVGRLQTEPSKSLGADADRLAGVMEEYARAARSELDEHDRHIRHAAQQLRTEAQDSLANLRAYANASRLPDDLGGWSGRHLVRITHDHPSPDEAVLVDQVERVIRARLASNSDRSDAADLLFAATRALVGPNGFAVRILKPHDDLHYERVDIGEFCKFSGGQTVTTAVLLYATMAHVRSRSATVAPGWLWLDNPFGQASADSFVATMVTVAERFGIQLVFTAAPKDKGAMSYFELVRFLKRKRRPSRPDEHLVVVDGVQDVVDLGLLRRSVAAALA